jgi:hypothetical protein
MGYIINIYNYNYNYFFYFNLYNSMSEHFRQLVREALHKAMRDHGLSGAAMLAGRKHSKRGGERMLTDDIKAGATYKSFRGPMPMKPMKAGASMLNLDSDSDDELGGSLLAGRRHRKQKGGSLLAGSLLAGVKPKKSTKGDGGKALAEFRRKVNAVRKHNPDMSYREAQQYVKHNSSR